MTPPQDGTPNDLHNEPANNRSNSLGRRGFMRTVGIAASGLAGIASAGSTTAQTSDHKELAIHGPGNGQVAAYQFSVMRDLLAVEGTLQSNDRIDDTGFGASGKVGGGTDRYLFTGEIDSFSYSGDLTVTIDGEQVDPDSLGSAATPEPESEPDAGNDTPGTSGHKELAIHGPGNGQVAAYQFSVMRDLLAVEETLQSNDRIDDTGFGASGKVGGGTDRYLFTGEIDSFSYSGDLTVTIDGEQVDPDSLSSDGSEPTDDDDGTPTADHKDLAIHGPGGGRVSSYEFGVTRDLLPVADTLQSNDRIDQSGTGAFGKVSGGTDRYRFTGEVDSFSYSGVLTVTIDGEQVAPDSLG